MTSSLASTYAVSSASQFSADTLLAMLERPSISLSQPVDVVPETRFIQRLRGDNSQGRSDGNL